MSSNRPDPGEFFERAQDMLRELFGGAPGEPGQGGSRPAHGPSPTEQRENLTFALATRAVEALEDLALNVAAIRQRLERVGGQPPRAEGGEPGPAGAGPTAP